MFYKVLLTREKLSQNSDVIYNLIDSSYHTANNDDILKVKKTNHPTKLVVHNNTQGHIEKIAQKTFLQICFGV